MQYGTGNYGDGEFSAVTDGYGSFLYGNGTYGQFHPRVDGAAGITSSTSMSATGGFLTDAQAAVTSSTSMVADGQILNDSFASITSQTLVVLDDSPGYVFEAEAHVTSSTNVVASARPILESAAQITSSTSIVAVGATTTDNSVEPILSITTVVASGRFKWEIITNPTSPTWTEIANPSDSWTPIN